MTTTGTIQFSRIHDAFETDLVLPERFSCFQPHIRHSIKETLELGGEVHTARNPEGSIEGIFIYDDFEKTGTVYTKSREVFDYFYELKPLSLIWSELETEHEFETYDIYNIELDRFPVIHTFKHQISVATDQDEKQLEQYMALTHPGINPKAVLVALRNGDKCLLVKFQNEIAGVGWLSLVNGIGRLFSLHVSPKYRRIGIGQDILFARLLWLKSKHAISAYSEISRNNVASARVSMNGGMSPVGRVFQYLGKDHMFKPKVETAVVALRS